MADSVAKMFFFVYEWNFHTDFTLNVFVMGDGINNDYVNVFSWSKPSFQILLSVNSSFFSDILKTAVVTSGMRGLVLIP